jgi:hypothetical protein
VMEDGKEHDGHKFGGFLVVGEILGELWGTRDKPHQQKKNVAPLSHLICGLRWCTRAFLDI